jgi:hypothetical protein
MKQFFLEKGQTSQRKTELQFEEVYRKVFKRKKKVKIIRLVRDPISRNISAFFENLKYKLDSNASLNDLNISDLIERFLKEYPHSVPLDWFDNEMKNVTGIDVFQKEFHYSKKYELYKAKNIELLLIRIDLDDGEKALLIKKFLKIKDFEIIRYNIGERKSYSQIYETFQEKICLPESYLNNMLDSKFTKHFYSQKEIEGIRKKWQKTYDTQ